ncbi:MAG TPA: DUF488 domain-containing protein [Candidatus Saccharimonadales bacterium]|nr:DUF488 domain-containing protein [Candidatus Saccharimonadales bacterium]
MIRLKRAYEPVGSDDGYRVLVDRLWPRGLSKEKLRLDIWLKEVGPSNELRKWFNHDPAKWQEFKSRYKKEITGTETFKELKKIVDENSLVTLVYGAADEEHNQAVALKEFLK